MMGETRETREMPHVLILGGGFGGAYCARELERRLGRGEARITLVNRTNYFAFTPLLIEAGTGALEPRHAVVPLRRFLERAQLHTAEVTEIDLEARRVTTRMMDGSQEALTYDHLLVALGSVTRMPDIPGLRQHAFGVNDLQDAVALRDRAIGLLELADQKDESERRRAMLTFVVVGGSYTGVEVTGELNEFLTEATSLYRSLRPEDVRIVLVDHGSRILKVLDEDLSGYASNRLKHRGVEIRLEDTVTRIHETSAELGSGETVGAWTVIWAAGVAPNPLLSHLGIEEGRGGFLACEPDLRVQGQRDVWAVGDCASNPGPDGQIYPPTAQHAIREGRQAARNIVRTLRSQTPEPLLYHSRGMMAPLGKHQGVARVFGRSLSGLPAWFIWRTFYLAKMPGFGRSLRVMMDWTLDWFFRRDCVQMGIHSPSGRNVRDTREETGPDSRRI